jgi:hypothetical protein
MHLLAVRGFANRKGAFDLELELKKRPEKEKMESAKHRACKQDRLPLRLCILATELAYKVDHGLSAKPGPTPTLARR